MRHIISLLMENETGALSRVAGLADIFRGHILDVTDKSYTIELTGPGAKLDAFLEALEPSAILETVRTGASGIGRGDRIMKI